MSQEEEKNRFLLCRIGSCIGALALKDVRETMRPLPIEPLAGAPPFVLGLAIIRGIPIPVMDAGSLIGTSPAMSPISPSAARFVSLKLDDRTVALAVDAVLDVCSLPSETLSSIPPLLLGGDAQLAAVMGALDSKLPRVLGAARLVPNSVWIALRPPGTFA